MSSTPIFSEFNPRAIPYQARVIDDVYFKFDYSLGTHEILLSGSVGSAKSMLLAHLAVRHCAENSNARVLLGRKALPDLKDTLFSKIIEHLQESFIEGTDFSVQHQIGHIQFRNGSEMVSRSWIDRKFRKFRSLELSMALIEELTENGEDDKEFYPEMKMRVGRLPHVKRPLIICASNPDSPAHWAYQYFILPNQNGKHPTRHVYYSVTTDNPFLPRQYIEQLKQDLSPKLARRMIYGEWIEIQGEVVYSEYSRDSNFRNYDYEINPKYPIILAWDFNIADGKPMSMACMQYIDDVFHIFDNVIIEGARTADTVEELDAREYFKNQEQIFYIEGDASGSHRDTRGTRSDYDIIKKELSARNVRFEYRVPYSNPSVRLRHNTVNAYCRNEAGLNRLFVYRKAQKVDEGLRLTQLKKGAGYIEDDSKDYQHVTTAIGYAIMFESTQAKRRKQGTIIL